MAVVTVSRNHRFNYFQLASRVRARGPIGDTRKSPERRARFSLPFGSDEVRDGKSLWPLATRYPFRRRRSCSVSRYPPTALEPLPRVSSPSRRAAAASLRGPGAARQLDRHRCVRLAASGSVVS